MSVNHCYRDLIELFANTFYQQYNTCLVKGDDEPIYLPAGHGAPYHQIVFAHGFYASAFHEIAHWCVAGEQRRLLEDYGYWYAPDGRDAEQQAMFENVELTPQAIEWAFCVASGFKFNVSVDNLTGVDVDRYRFQSRVQARVMQFLEDGFPPRAQQFIDALMAFYQTGSQLQPQQFVFINPLTPSTKTSMLDEHTI
ncbi:elongation factor P hydroxylase [Thalassotalea ponticola]|uniref:elongation factor P hydroxylase n=1 Tax=Thalassotalea ponticola TaxID=1523392 RepID=UPI0025B33C7C|nr:elongation factor P hydroxylase [Thalassotalea ponticola]MDN3653905.1 elongation factor P hydroxylase [Thalassotalea ponticola]